MSRVFLPGVVQFSVQSNSIYQSINETPALMPLTFVGCCNSMKYVSACQNLRPLGTVTPGRWYLIGSCNSPEWQGWRKKRWLSVLTHMFAWFLNLQTFIYQVNIGTKSSLQKHPKALCQRISCNKWTHLKNLKVRGSLERWPKRWLNDDHSLSLWVLADTPPQREH